MRDEVKCTNCKNIRCFIKQFCENTLSKISEGKIQSWYKKGDYIFREGNPMLGIFFIQKGGVKVSSSSLDGRGQVVRLAGDGNILGHRVLGKDRYYFNAIAMKDTLICFMDSDTFRNICLNNPEFTYNLVLFYAQELRRTELRVKYLAQMNTREKVAETFVYFNEVFGIDPDTKILKIDVNRQDIADTAGTTAEQVTRQLNDFEDEKLILRKKRIIHLLNIPGLKKIVKDYKTD